MSLDTLVQVSIVAKSTGVARTGFGQPLIAHFHAKWPERVRRYTSVQAMLDDGFTAGDAAVRAASAIFSQIPSPPAIKIGRMETTAVAHVETLEPTAKNSTKYSLDIADSDGVITTFNYTSDATATVAEICAALLAAVNADTGLAVTASGGVTNLILTGDVAGEVFYLRAYDNESGYNWKRTCTNADPGIATDLAAINGADPDWYGLVVTNPAAACQSAAASWAETNRRLLAITTGDTDARDSVEPNIMDTIKTAAQAHSFAIYSDRPQEFAAAGLEGKIFPLEPGSATWAHKSLRNVSSVPVSETHKSNIEAAYGNWYATEAGVAHTFPGKTGAGEFIDVTHGIDWLKARVQEEIYSLLINNEKIPFTDAGIAAVESKIRAVLEVGANNGFLVRESIVVTVPKASALLSTDKANRVLTGITFAAQLAGAAHTLVIKGTLTV